MLTQHNVAQAKQLAENTWNAYSQFSQYQQKLQEDLRAQLRIDWPDSLFIDADPLYDMIVILRTNNERSIYHWDDFLQLVAQTEEGKTPDWSTLRKIDSARLSA